MVHKMKDYKKIIIFILILFILLLSVINVKIALLLSAILLVGLFLLIFKDNGLYLITIFGILIISSYSFIKIVYITILILTFIYILLTLLKKRSNNLVIQSKSIVFFIVITIFLSIQLLFLERYESTLRHVSAIIFGAMIIWLMKKNINTPDRLNQLYIMWAIIIIGSLIIGFWEIVTGDSIRSSVAYPGSHVATVGFYNPNNFSFYLAISIPAIYYLLQKSLIFKIISIIGIGGIFLTVYLNNTRSILILLILSLLMVLVKLFIDGYKKTVTITSVLFVVVLILNVEIINQLFETLKTLSQNDFSVSIRKQLTIDGLNIAKNNIILGVGPGNSEYHMPNIGDKVHNYWLEMLINYGIIIFIILVYYYINTIFKLIKMKKSRLYNVIWPILWSIIIFIPASLAPSTIFTLPILWFLFGLIISARNIINNYKKGFES